MSRTRVRSSWKSLRPWQRHAITGALVVALIALCVVVRNATGPDEATAQVPAAAPPGNLPPAPDAKPAAPSNVAAIVNDVSGLTHDPRLAEVTSKAGATLIIGHWRRRHPATPGSLPARPVTGSLTRVMNLLALLAATQD